MPGFVIEMKPLSTEIQDISALQDLGRASVQIVHDLKNQLNGLKLYATFLRKRMEQSERPADELETLTKLINGLERAASDMTTLVRYSRPLELRAQPKTDLLKILRETDDAAAVPIDDLTDGLAGDFDVAAMTEALRTITSTAATMCAGDKKELRINVRSDGSGRQAIIEWLGISSHNGDDPFRSFARSEGLRMALAAKIIEAHGGEVEHEANILRVRLPLAQNARRTLPPA